jgi:hypothetical protein
MLVIGDGGTPDQLATSDGVTKNANERVSCEAVFTEAVRAQMLK